MMATQRRFAASPVPWLILLMVTVVAWVASGVSFVQELFGSLAEDAVTGLTIFGVPAAVVFWMIVWVAVTVGLVRLLDADLPKRRPGRAQGTR